MASSNELSHYGVLGMKWGVRRYQNRDGTLTTTGKKRLTKNASKPKSKLSPQEKKDVAKAVLKATAEVGKAVERQIVESQFTIRQGKIYDRMSEMDQGVYWGTRLSRGEKAANDFLNTHGLLQLVEDL